MNRLYITDQHPEAPGMWVAADWDTGNVVYRPTGSGDAGRAKAVALLASTFDLGAITAAAGDQLVPWTSDSIAVIGVPTSDKRQIDEGALRFRALPLPLMLMTQTSFGHDGAVIAGRMDSVSVQGSSVPASGVFDTGVFGVEAARLAQDQMITGLSIDLGTMDVVTEILAVDADGWPTDWLDHFADAECVGLTQCPFPAFEGAFIKVAEAAAPDNGAPVAVAASADPPVTYYANPQFQGPTAVRIGDPDADGFRPMSGHIALWGTCHIGRQGVCVTPPPSANDYSLFCTGYVKCEDGCEVPIGTITLGGGHADINLNAALAKKHYDDSGFAAADVAVGEDDHGVWIAGTVRPGVTDEQVRELRASSPSGDWRNFGGQLELIAILQVNVPGFPVPRARTASGESMALVAAVAPREQLHPTRTLAQLSHQIDRLTNVVSTMAPLVADQIGSTLRS